MQTKEMIRVFVDVQNGKTVCICERSHKRCNKKCEKDIVERDKFRGWQQTMKRDKYGCDGE